VTKIDGAVVETFVKLTQGYTAVTWMICDQPPNQVCLPADPLLKLSESDAGHIQLLDCDGDRCRTMNVTSNENGRLCLSAAINPGDDPTCAQGCAYARLPDVPSAQPSRWLIVVPFLIVFVVLGLLTRLLLVFFMRRREKEEPEEGLETGLNTN
jgi:hypothetical protein